MKKMIGIITALLMLAGGVQAAEWTFDKPHSAIKFKVKHLMVTNVWGQFTKWDGKVMYNPDDITKSKVEVTIDASSIDTDNEKRDGHLRSQDFLYVEKYPKITFVSKGITRTDDGIDIQGDLTIRGVTREVTLSVEGPTGPISFQGTPKMAASATTTIDRTKYGVEWNKTLETGGVLVGDEVHIVIDVEMDKVQ